MLILVWILALLAAFMLPQALQAWLNVPQVSFSSQLAQYIFAGLMVGLAFAASQWWRTRKHPWRSTGLPLFTVIAFAVSASLLLTSLIGVIHLPPQGDAARIAVIVLLAIASAIAANACYDLERRRLRLWLALFLSRRHGRRDGEEGIPSIRNSESGAKHLGVLKNRGELAGSTIGGDFVKSDNRVRREYREAHHRYLELAADLRKLDQYAKEDRLHESKATISPRWYFIALCLLVVSEFPLNTVAFQILGESTAATALMTLSLAITLLACAHGLGSALHTPKDPAERENARPEFAPVIKKWIAVLIVIPILACLAVASVRFFFLGLGTDGLLPSQNLPFIAVAFLVINLLIYTAGTMLSWLYHNPFTENERLRGDQRAAMEAARAELQSNFEEHRVRYEGEKNYWQTLYAAYAQANERARQGEAHVTFGVEAVLDDPAPLDESAKAENKALAARWDEQLDRWDQELMNREIPNGIHRRRGPRQEADTEVASGNGDGLPVASGRGR